MPRRLLAAAQVAVCLAAREGDTDGDIEELTALKKACAFKRLDFTDKSNVIKQVAHNGISAASAYTVFTALLAQGGPQAVSPAFKKQNLCVFWTLCLVIA